MIDPTVLALRRQLATEVLRIADQTQFTVAAMRLGIGPPRLTDLRQGRVERFSLERLIRMLATVGRRVDLTVVTVGPRRVRWLRKTPGVARRRRPSRP